MQAKKNTNRSIRHIKPNVNILVDNQGKKQTFKERK